MKKPTTTVAGNFPVEMTLQTTHMPVFGETLIGSDFDMEPGGKGLNKAAGVAKPGADAIRLKHLRGCFKRLVQSKNGLIL